MHPILRSLSAMRLLSGLLISTAVLVSAAALAVPLVKPTPSLVAQQTGTVASADASRPQAHKGGILQSLNLTRDQLRQIAKARQKYQPLIQDHARTVRALQAELKRLMAGTAEPAEVQDKFRQLQAQRQQLQQLRFESSLAIRQILTPPQRQAFEAALSKRQAKSNK
jgi:periplasmic protein CpxP/Spy